MKPILFFLFIVFSSVRLIAQNLEIPYQSDYSGIIVRVKNAQLTWSESAGPSVILGGFDRNHWNFKKDDKKRLVLESKLYDADNVKGAPVSKLSVKSPSVPIVIFGDDLSFNIESYKSKVELSIIKGQFKSFKTQGDMQIMVLNGDVNIEHHVGTLNLTGSQVKVSYKMSQGDARVSVLNGQIFADRNTGQLGIDLFNGTTQISQHSGGALVEQSKGSMNIATSQGRFDVVTEEASAEVKATKDLDFNMRTKTGKLNFSSAGVTGIWLNLNSKENDLFLPGSLKPQKVKTEVFFKGRTSGEKSNARVDARSVNAAIIIR